VNMFASKPNAATGVPATGRNVCDVAVPASGVNTIVAPLIVAT
jgi:hypothetical protein